MEKLKRESQLMPSVSDSTVVVNSGLSETSTSLINNENKTKLKFGIVIHRVCPRHGSKKGLNLTKGGGEYLKEK